MHRQVKEGERGGMACCLNAIRRIVIEVSGGISHSVAEDLPEPEYDFPHGEGNPAKRQTPIVSRKRKRVAS